MTAAQTEQDHDHYILQFLQTPKIVVNMTACWVCCTLVILWNKSQEADISIPSVDLLVQQRESFPLIYYPSALSGKRFLVEVDQCSLRTQPVQEFSSCECLLHAACIYDDSPTRLQSCREG